MREPRHDESKRLISSSPSAPPRTRHLVQTLIIWSSEDNSLPLSCAEEMPRLLKGSRLEIIDDAGYLGNFDRPEVFNRPVAEFLKVPAA